MSYSEQGHKEIIEAINKVVGETPLTEHQRTRLIEVCNQELGSNPQYVEASRQDSLIGGRAEAFAKVYELIAGYKDGHPISGVYLFNALRKLNVYVEGLTFSENLKAFDRLMDDVVCSDAKKLKEFEEALASLKKSTENYLKAWCAKNAIARTVEMQVWQAFKSNGLPKNEQRPKRKK